MDKRAPWPVAALAILLSLPHPARGEDSELPGAHLVIMVDRAVEVFDPTDGRLIRRVELGDEPKIEWSDGVAVAGYFLAEGSFLPKGAQDRQRSLSLLDQDGNLLWTRTMPREASISLAIYLSPEGVASFSSPQGGHIVDAQGKELWQGRERPVGPLLAGYAPMQTSASDHAKEPTKWLRLADQTWLDEAPVLQPLERGAFVEKNRLVFADGIWVRQNRWLEHKRLATHQVGQRSLPKGCNDPDLDGEPPDRFWRLTCEFSRPRADLKVAYRVDVQKMTMDALRTLPPGWKSEEEIICLFHQSQEKPEKQLVAHLGLDGYWYSSTERDGSGIIWRSTDGSHWRKLGEISSPCGSPYLSDLCGHLFVEPKMESGHCGSSGFAVNPLVEHDGALIPLPPAVDGVAREYCSPDRTRFLAPDVRVGDFSGNAFRELRKFTKGEHLARVFWVPLAARPRE
jgi:hypothetical protein